MSPAEPELRRSALVERFPRSYGWIVLVAATVGMMMTIPGQTSGLAVFLDAMIADLGMTRSHVATLYLVGTLLGSLVLPSVGRFVDRKGPRLAVVVIAALFAGACVWMGSVQGTVTLLIGFTLIRALGQGALSLVSVHAAAIWFVRRRGIAVAIIGIGWAIWTAAYPSLVERFLAPYGWRTSYALLGAMVALTILPLGGLLFRERPERFGLVADGVGGGRSPAALGTSAAPGPLPAEPAYTAREARATLTFWLFLTGLFLSSTFGTGLIFHHYAILAQGGIGRELAAAAFVPLGLMAGVGNLAAGALLPRVPPRFLLSAKLLLLGGALLLAGRVSSEAAVWLYGATLGLRGGMYASLEGNVFAVYFGRSHVGAIRGQVATALVVGSAVGPLLFSVGLDAAGSYAPIVTAAALPTFALGLAAPFLRLRVAGRVR
jgi:MFS transporter, OFA family, oxalate/formate antiporter